MQARTMLAIMDHNENHESPRQPEATTSGKYQKYTNYKFSYEQLNIVTFHS